MAVSLRLGEVAFPWFDRRRLLGLVLAATAGLLVLMLTQPEPRVPILVASADLQPGHGLTANEVSVRYVESSSGLVEGASLGELEDWTVRVPILAGEPLLASLLQPPEILVAPNVVALSLDPAHAVLGRLVAGDHVDIYQTAGGGIDGNARTELIASDVYVVESRFDVDGINGGSVDLLLAVDDELAVRIVAGDRLGEIDLVRVAP
jgi:Flp pilus assembly protein CpaB